MNHTVSKSKVDNPKIVIFGAGKIGRSFIGQLFGCGGYKVVFVDIDPVIVNLLNQKGCYRVVIKGDEEDELIVPNVEAISALDTDMVAEAVSTAGILAVSVGKNALSKIAPIIARGLLARFKTDPDLPLDIILAENMRSAGEFVKEQLEKSLPSHYPIEQLVGLIETSIGKMVPIITAADLEKDPLMVYAEPYNTLIVDGKGFKSQIPQIQGLAPKDNIKAWVDRKAFIHNLGHATASYFGFFSHPESVYLYEVLDDQIVFDFTRQVMLQSAEILLAVYPKDFAYPELVSHIDDLLHRFMNRALKDTIFRVGQDLSRKLGSDDRFMGAIHLAIENGKPYDKIVHAMSYGLFFNAKDELGLPSVGDEFFLEKLTCDLENTLIDFLGYNQLNDRLVIDSLKEYYSLYKNQEVQNQ
ncbi:MAG: NAD-binding protein [Mariniphaga sp.]